MPPLHRSERQTSQDQKQPPPADEATVFDSALQSLRGGNCCQSPEPPPDEGEAPEVTEATLKAVRRQVHDLYTGDPNVGYCHDLNGKHVGRLVATLRGVAKKRRERLNVTVERAVRGFLADPYWRASRWPLNGLVSQCVRYGDPPSDAEVGATIVDKTATEFQTASIESKIRAAQTDLALAKSAQDHRLVGRIETHIAKLRGELTQAKATLAR